MSTKHRTIELTDVKRQQIAMAAAALGISGSQFIMAAIQAAIVSLGQADPTLALMFSRAAGTSWKDLQSAERSDVIDQLTAAE